MKRAEYLTDGFRVYGGLAYKGNSSDNIKLFGDQVDPIDYDRLGSSVSIFYHVVNRPEELNDIYLGGRFDFNYSTFGGIHCSGPDVTYWKSIKGGSSD